MEQWVSGWVLAGVALLMLSLGGLMGLMVWRRRRRTLHPSLHLDALTGLPNEQQYLADRPVAASALILLELNAFHDITVIFGQEVADQAVLKVATLLQEVCAGQGILYRMGRGEFLVLCPSHLRNKVVHLMGRIIYFITNENYHIHDHAALMSVTAGIALDVTPYDRALSYARLAKDEARRQRKDWVIYQREQNLEKRFEENLHILGMVHKALRQRQVVPYYQPILDIHDNRIVGCEALIRLRDSEGNLYAPGAFLNVVKRSNLYRQLTLAMIQTVLLQFSTSELTVSLNLDAIDIKDDGIVTALLDGVVQYGMAGRVIVELSESEYMHDTAQVAQVAQRLRQHGIRLAIDDFGAGYSNFETVTRFDIDSIKVDGSLIHHFMQTRTSHAMVKAIASFALELGIPLVAEYVTSAEEVRELKRLQFRYLQGYHIGEPMPFEALSQLFAPLEPVLLPE